MFVVSFLPFPFCPMVFPCFHLLSDVDVGVEFSGLFSYSTYLFLLGNVLSHGTWEHYSKLSFLSFLDDPKRTKSEIWSYNL